MMSRMNVSTEFNQQIKISFYRNNFSTLADFPACTAWEFKLSWDSFSYFDNNINDGNFLIVFNTFQHESGFFSHNNDKKLTMIKIHNEFIPHFISLSEQNLSCVRADNDWSPDWWWSCELNSSWAVTASEAEHTQEGAAWTHSNIYRTTRRRQSTAHNVWLTGWPVCGEEMTQQSALSNNDGNTTSLKYLTLKKTSVYLSLQNSAEAPSSTLNPA